MVARQGTVLPLLAVRLLKRLLALERSFLRVPARP